MSFVSTDAMSRTQYKYRRKHSCFKSKIFLTKNNNFVSCRFYYNRKCNLIYIIIFYLSHHLNYYKSMNIKIWQVTAEIITIKYKQHNQIFRIDVISLLYNHKIIDYKERMLFSNPIIRQKTESIFL